MQCLCVHRCAYALGEEGGWREGGGGRGVEGGRGVGDSRKQHYIVQGNSKA